MFFLTGSTQAPDVGNAENVVRHIQGKVKEQCYAQDWSTRSRLVKKTITEVGTDSEFSEIGIAESRKDTVMLYPETSCVATRSLMFLISGLELRI